MLLTKLHIPPLGKNYIHRTILFDQLNEWLSCKLILVSAPAGFGKTTLISDWIIQHGIPTAWFSLDKGDNDPAEFLGYVISGIQGIHEGFGQNALRLIKSPNKPTDESITNLLINEIVEIPNNFLLVLDDFHLISSNEILNIVSYLLEHIPQNIHLVISTRSDPVLPLAKLRSQQQILELRSSELGFSVNDISKLFNKKLKLGLSIEDIIALESKTEGWIAGLQLAALSMQGIEDTSSFIEELAGSNRYIMDYLIEEVLKIQSDEVKEFLLKTSILRQISAPLSNALLQRTDSQLVLENLEKNNMFVFPLDTDRQWYRYHHLFADLLQQRLLLQDQPAAEELHHRACEWFEEQNMKDLAIEHALAVNNHGKSINLIGEIVERMWENGQHAAIMNYGDLLPDELILKNPEFCFYYAWILIFAGKFEKAELFLAGAESIIKQRIIEKDSSENSIQFSRKLLGKISVAFAQLNSHTGQSDKIIAYCNTAMENLTDDDPLWYSWAWFSTGMAKLVLEKYRESIDDLNKALEYGKKSGNIYLMSTIVTRLSFINHRLGQYKSAYKICSDLLSFMKERGYSEIAKMDWTFAGLFSNLAMMQYMWADWDGALENIKVAYNLYKSESNVLVKYVVLFGYSMVLQGRGDLAGSAEKLNELDELLREHTISPQQKSTYIAWKGYILIQLGQINKAYEFLKENGLSLDEEISYTNEHGYMAYANLLLTESKTKEAEILLSKLYKLAYDGNRIERLHELKIFYASLYNLNGTRNEAIKCLIESMEYASTNDIIMYFILYLDKIDDLLKETFKILATSKTKVPAEFVEKLKLALEDSEKRKKHQAEAALSSREIEILQLMAKELSNQEIADKLFISSNTVKTHLKNINLKLEVDNRTKAVAKATELSLI